MDIPITPAPSPGLHVGGDVLYKTQRSGVFRSARIRASRRDSVTVIFPRCNTERTVPWSTVVVFDADKVDQPWRPCNGPAVAEGNGFGPGASEVSAVANTVGAINARGTASGEPVIGSKFGQTLVPNTLASPRPKRMPPSMKARTTGRPGFYETWRHVPLANENADWTRAQVAKGHHRAHDPRWCVRTAVGMQQWEPGLS